jgi:hypothetical protein
VSDKKKKFIPESSNLPLPNKIKIFILDIHRLLERMVKNGQIRSLRDRYSKMTQKLQKKSILSPFSVFDPMPINEGVSKNVLKLGRLPILIWAFRKST